MAATRTVGPNRMAIVSGPFRSNGIATGVDVNHLPTVQMANHIYAAHAPSGQPRGFVDPRSTRRDRPSAAFPSWIDLPPPPTLNRSCRRATPSDIGTKMGKLLAAARRSRRICEDLAGEGRGGCQNERSLEDRRDSPCDAERATTAKAIAAYVSFAEPSKCWSRGGGW